MLLKGLTWAFLKLNDECRTCQGKQTWPQPASSLGQHCSSRDGEQTSESLSCYFSSSVLFLNHHFLNQHFLN